MKLRSIEKLAIAVTVLIFAILAGYGYGSSQAGAGTFYVHTEKELPKEALLLPTPGAEVIPLSDDANPGSIGGEKININTATAQELQTLPGIGEAIAERIIKYREDRGGFGTADDIMNVRGIGEKTYDKLSDLITVMEGEQ